MSNLERAMEIAEAAHQGQSDRTGRPYIEHCRRVVDSVETLDQKIVAYLHDTLERGGSWTRSKLADEGFSPQILAAVDGMTRGADEDYASFVRRAASNRLARGVKRADLEDNIRQAREVGEPTEKYEEGLRILEDEFGA